MMVTSPPKRLPNAMRIKIVAEENGSQWMAATTVYDIYDVLAEPQQPLPAATARSRAAAEAAALDAFRQWANRHWPRRTLPDPV